MIYMYIMQFWMLFHPPFSNLQSEQYLLSCCDNAPFLALFHSDSTNIAQIANRRPGGERTPKTAYFTYRTSCDTIRTQKPNWSQSSEFTKMRLCWMQNPAKITTVLGAVWVLNCSSLGCCVSQQIGLLAVPERN